MHRIFLAGTALALSLIPLGASAQDTNGRPASFDERYRLEPTSPETPVQPTPAQQTPAQQTPAQQMPAQQTRSQQTPAQQTRSQQTPAQPPSASTRQTVTTGQNVATSRRAARTERPRTRVVVLPRSYLDAGTEVLPGERKFLDYAYPPTYQPLNVVTNTGGRVGWHNSPLPGPFFPTTN